MFEIIGAIGQYAAIQLRLLRWKLIELCGYARVLVIGEEILDARVESQAARRSGLQLRSRAGLLRFRRRRRRGGSL